MRVCFRAGSAASRQFGTALALLTLAACPFASSARADDYMTETPVPKKALVIGVSNYLHLPKLPVSKLNSNHFKARVESFNFIVTQATATDRSSLIRAVQGFADTLNEGDIALVYYSGHGFQRNEFNYLVPSDAPACPGNVVREDIPVTYISEQLEKHGVAAYLLVLDACRTTPQDCRPVVAERRGVVKSPAPLSQGLAAPNPPLDHEVIYASWMIALAASPGKPAWSGSDGSNGSLYSRHLAELFGTKGWDLTKTFDGVRRKVRENSGGQQIPSEQRVMYGDIFIDPDDVMRRNYRDAWQRTRSLGDVETVKYYLLSFPESPYAAMARKWLKDRAEPGTAAPGMLLSSADQPAVLASAEPSEPETRSRGFSLRGPARERRGVGAASPGGHVAEREPARERKFFTMADRPTQSQQFDSFKGKARSEEERVLEVAERTKTKVLTLNKPQAAPEGSGSWVAIEVNTIDGVPVSESLKGKASGSPEQPKAVPLKELFPDKERGMPGADSALDQFGELKGSKVEVELSDSALDAPTQGHARMQAFQRSLQIRKDLLDSGVEPSKIVVKMPEKFQLEADAARSVATPDQLTIIKPDK